MSVVQVIDGTLKIKDSLEVKGTIKINDELVICGCGSHIENVTGGKIKDIKARTAINDLLEELRALGIIAPLD